MKYSVLLCVSLCISQIVFLGVFSGENNSYYVINTQENLCGVFTLGDNTNPNWLMEGWSHIEQQDDLSAEYSSQLSCIEGNVGKCCRDLGYRYAGVPIGIASVSQERKGAEFLASRKIIQKWNLAPSKYNLDSNITRKELLKIIIGLSNISPQEECKEIFIDVKNDWACKYIETALENDYIAGKEKFRPNDYVTKTEALKLIFKARDIEKRYNTDYWQQDYISTAYYLGYISEKFSDYNSSMTRGEIFKIASKTYSEFKNW